MSNELQENASSPSVETLGSNVKEFFTELSSLQHQGKTIKIKGIQEGLTVRIDGTVDWREVIDEIRQFFSSSRLFLRGGKVSLEWVGKVPSKERCKELEMLLKEEFDIIVVSSPRKTNKLSLANAPVETEKKENPAGDSLPSGLFEEGAKIYSDDSANWDNAAEIIAKLSAGKVLTNEDFIGTGSRTTKLSHPIRNKNKTEMSKEKKKEPTKETDYIAQVNNLLGEEYLCDSEANAKIIFGTLRSGQRIETPFSLVVVGDVNPGAEIISGGDIIVLGHLRGTAHAAAYDDDGAGHIIFAIKMQPMQLRIGSVISRGASDDGSTKPEIARIEDKRIVVENFSTRSAVSRNR